VERAEDGGDECGVQGNQEDRGQKARTEASRPPRQRPYSPRVADCR
jgi:hypothetical protein